MIEVYCSTCGSRMVNKETGLPSKYGLLMYDFDRGTGKPNLVEKYVCPKKPWFTLKIFDHEDRFYEVRNDVTNNNFKDGIE